MKQLVTPHVMSYLVSSLRISESKFKSISGPGNCVPILLFIFNDVCTSESKEQV